MKTSKIIAIATLDVHKAAIAMDQAREALYQARIRRDEAEELQKLGVVAHGVREYGDGGWTRWFLFTAGAPFAPDVAAIHRAEMELAKDGGSAEAWGSALETVDAFLARLPMVFPGSGGPGQAFAFHPSLRTTRNHVLVTQTGGLDI